MSDLRFENRVAIVTGAGNGLGRSHALLLASRGAKVVVNDLGGTATGGGKSSAAADKVVEEIKAAGGEAVANYDSVEDGAKIVQQALDTWKRIDIIVNNAGILRDTSFQKMTQDDWDLIYRVHVLGAFRVTKAAWDHMREAGFGRIIFTASAAGIYGNFGQANYAMAKLGLHGFAQTLALEGKKKNVHANTIAPIAGSRLTETVLPKDITDALKPEYVSPLVAWLAHESCEENGGLFEVGGGLFAKLRWERTEGKIFKLGKPMQPEQLQKAWGQITDFSKSTHPTDITSSMQPILGNLQTKSLGGNEFIDVDAALGYEFPPQTSSYDEKDLALYALGVGA
ncbi:MAG TPA: SDR family NAD(P)-dependent oxidoreductase, partial [Labilithrix sp.]|nr:SDR family NAD(P)-dependent oxidoreductase [Labilithrix sp.]